MKGITTVIFDMDGIIFDTERLVLNSWTAVAEKRGVAGIKEVVLESTGTTLAATREIAERRLGREFPFDEFRQEASVIFHETVRRDGMPVKKGVGELLSYLKKNHYKIGLASSTRRAVVEEELRDAGFLSCFDVVVGGDMIAHSKPDPEIFLTCCKKLGSTPQETLVIEDSYNGIRAAGRAGMMVFMVPDLLPPTDEMRMLSSGIFESLSDVQKYMENNGIQ